MMITKALLVGPPHADIANLGDLLLQCGCLVGNVDVPSIFNGLSWLENGDERSGSGDGTQLPPQLPPGLVIQTPPQLEEHGQGSPGNSTVFIYICSDTTADGRECASLAGLRLRCLKLQCPNVVAVLDCNGASGVLKDRTSSPKKEGKAKGKARRARAKARGRGRARARRAGAEWQQRTTRREKTAELFSHHLQQPGHQRMLTQQLTALQLVLQVVLPPVAMLLDHLPLPLPLLL